MTYDYKNYDFVRSTILGVVESIIHVKKDEITELIAAIEGSTISLYSPATRKKLCAVGTKTHSLMTYIYFQTMGLIGDTSITNSALNTVAHWPASVYGGISEDHTVPPVISASDREAFIPTETDIKGMLEETPFYIVAIILSANSSVVAEMADRK